MNPTPLKGLVILDLTQIFNGPYATFLMAAAGADVIKIEPPAGEHLRLRTIGKASWLPFAMLNAGKRSLKLDLKSEAGKEVLLRLVEKADVLVENFAAGVMERLGLGEKLLKERNPRLIYASSTGYGTNGPYRDYPAMDLTVQAMSGVINATGFTDSPPVKAGPAMCDFMSGVHLYAAIVTALLDRERTGAIHSAEVSMMEATYFSLSSNLGMIHAAVPGAPARTGNRHGALVVCPYNVYPTADGHIAIIINHNQHWKALVESFDRPDLVSDARYKDNADRVRNMQEVDDLVASWTQSLTRAAIFERLIAVSVPCAPVRDLHEVMNDPHLHQRGSLRWIDHPEYGRIAAPASPLRFDGVAALPERPSVPLGTDSVEILREKLGLDDPELDHLASAGVI